MSHLSTVYVDPPSGGGLFLATWAQPFNVGEDAEAWHATSGGTPRQVQRDRLTDRVYLCRALVAAGTTSFSVDTGPTTSPATAWTAPNLAGLALRHYGQDGSRSAAVLDGTDGATVSDTLRDGHLSRSIRRWIHAKVDQVGAGTQTLGTEVLGTHAYLTYRADWPGVVELDVVITNASATVAAQGNGIAGLFGSVYLTGSELVVPAGWAAIAERSIPAPASGAYVFPTKLGTVRRFVLHKLDDAANAVRAAELLELRGLGFAREGSSYLTVPSFLPLETILPDLAQGYTYSGTSGYAGAELRGAARYASIRAAVDAGTGGGVEYLLAPRLGYFHPLGEIDPQAPGGSDVDTHAGVEAVRSNVRFERLRGDLKIDGSGVWLLNRATGRPIRTHDFGDAYTTPGTIPNYDPSPAYVGRQPFSFWIQNNGGFEIGTKDTATMLGWWPPAWPPHFLDNRGTLPNGAGNPTFDKFVPTYPPSGWGPAPHSLNVGTCAFETDLVSSWLPHPVYGSSGYYVGQLAHRDPEDGQHLIRMTLRAMFLAWACGDLVSIDWLDMVAEWSGYAWSEIGHVPYLYYPPYNSRSLRFKWEAVTASPGTGAAYIGREGGWVGYTFAAQFALASVARREDGYPAKGIKRRAEMMLETIKGTALPDGATYRLPYSAAGGAGQLAEAWAAPTGALSGPPIPQRYSIMQVGLEMPFVHTALFALARQLDRVAEIKPTILRAFRAHTGETAAYVVSQYNANEWGPAKYAAVWDDLTGQPWSGPNRPRAFDGTGNPGHPNHEVMVELAYRLTGSTDFLDVSHLLGFRSPPGTTRAQRGSSLLGASSWPFGAGMIGYLLGQAGPDSIGGDPPPVVSLSLSLTFGVNLSATLELVPVDPPPVDPPPVDPPAQGGSGGGSGGIEAPAPTDYTVEGANPLGPAALLRWSVAGGTLRPVGGDLERESGLASAVLISVFSDRRIDADPLRPLEVQDLRGWWGEDPRDPFGSRLWTLARGRVNAETAARAQDAVRESLEWMISNGIARRIDVSATWSARGLLALEIGILRGTSRRWAHLWNGATNFRLLSPSVTIHVAGR